MTWLEHDGPWVCAQVGHMWRTTKDISMEIEATWADVVENLDETAGLARFAGPGGWNDADMLEVLGHLTRQLMACNGSTVRHALLCHAYSCQLHKIYRCRLKQIGV